MPILKAKPKESKLDSAQIARQWLSMGVKPIPLYPESKKPRGKAWQKARITKPLIDQFFHPGDNVGGLWGDPSDGIVDIDLDWDEAAMVATHLLPETFIYGREKRPSTHYLYRCKGVPSTKFGLQSGEVVVEIRSTGAQSVLPPSIHPEHDRYSINHEVAFSTVTPNSLIVLCQEVAAAGVLIRNFPDHGSRHDYIHALTGALLWGGWEEDRTRRFMKALIACTIDDDKNQRERTLHNTMEHFKKGSRVQGWTTMANWLDAKIITTLKNWLVAKPKFEDVPPRVKRESHHIPVFDPEWGRVPGVVGEIAEWSSRLSFQKQPAFDLACGLMCVAITSGNKYLVQGWNTPLQPYIMILGPTASGKNASMSNVYKFSRLMSMHENVYQGFQSYYALLDKLAEPPNQACWLWDEAARHMAAAKSPGSPDYSTISHLTSLYGRATESVPAAPGRRQSIPALDHPFLTLMATAQPAALLDAITVSTVATGFVNRLILFDAGDEAPSANEHREDIFPSVMKDRVMAIKRHQVKNGKDFTYVMFEDNSVHAMFANFNEKAGVQAAKGDEYQSWGRANQNALILAGIVAVGISPAKPRITTAIADWAINLIRWSISCWLVRIGESSSRSRREGQSKRVEAMVRRSVELAHRADSSRYRDWMKKGLMPRAILQRMNRDLNKRELDEIIEVLIESGILGQTEQDTGAVTYWPKGR